MTTEFGTMRDLTREILDLIDLRQTFTDIHIEQDRPIMIKTPRGWVETGDGPVLFEEMLPMLEAIDPDWQTHVSAGALDRPFVLTRCRLRCNVYRSSGGRKTVISMRRLPLEPLALDKLGLPAYVKTMLEATKGLVLVTGPTGSGKTTTISSLLDCGHFWSGCRITERIRLGGCPVSACLSVACCAIAPTGTAASASAANAVRIIGATFPWAASTPPR